MGESGGGNGRGVQEEGAVCTHIAYSLHCTAETQNRKATIPQVKRKKENCQTVSGEALFTDYQSLPNIDSFKLLEACGPKKTGR